MKQLKVFAIPLLFCSALSTAVLLTAHSPMAATACSSLTGVPLLDGAVTSATDVTAPFRTTPTAMPPQRPPSPCRRHFPSVR